LGLTFKEDISDTRNTKVIDIVHELQKCGVALQIHDPLADEHEVARAYNLTLIPREELQPSQAVIVATSHQLYREAGWGLVQDLLLDGVGFVADVRCILDRESVPDGVELWRL
jgi:UDP-N-acetyl-D-galactosamine dehydrogenase